MTASGACAGDVRYLRCIYRRDRCNKAIPPAVHRGNILRLLCRLPEYLPQFSHTCREYAVRYDGIRPDGL